MGKRSRRRQQQKQKEEDLDRFAGSSEEEEEEEASVDSEGENESNHDEAPSKRKQNKHHPQESKEEKEVKASLQQELENIDSDVDPVADDNDDDDVVVASGMAAAMSKILGTKPSRRAGVSSIVLSKTTTPLQRMALEEKQLEKEQREKRRANRERNLMALHIPLSVATSRVSPSSNSGGQAVAMELEQERTHRRVATRGVVALFNAIAQHQKKQQETHGSTSTKGEAKQPVKKLSKHGFLDMIKSTAAAKSSQEEQQQDPTTQNNDNSKTTAASQAPPSSKSKWNALQDDYMLNSKLKDWDKESSEDEEDVGDNQDWASDDDEVNEPQPTKKRRVHAT